MRGKRQAPTSRWTITFGVTLIALGVLSFNAWASFRRGLHCRTAWVRNVDAGPHAEQPTNRLARAYHATDVAPGDTIQRGST